MRVKNILLLGFLVGLLSITSNAQKTSIDSNYFSKKLPEYQASSCLSNLFISIVKSNTRFYNPNKYFYSVTFNKRSNQKYLNVTPVLWRNAKNLDYTGVLKIRNVIFLCRGDFESDSLFKKKTSTTIRIKLQQSKDSTDWDPFTLDPSLDGVFYDCRGLPIHVEVYTEGKIQGYERKVRHQDIKQ